MRCLTFLFAAFLPTFAQARIAPAEDATTPAQPALRRWDKQHRSLQIQTGVSWSLVGVGVIGMSIPLATLVSCSRDLGPTDCETFGELIAVPLFAALIAASIVPAIVYTDRLVEHRRRRHAVLSRLRFGPGGLSMSF